MNLRVLVQFLECFAYEYKNTKLVIEGEGTGSEQLQYNEELILATGWPTHMCPTGAGQATKLINQTLVLNNFVVIAEGMRLAEAYGVDARRVFHQIPHDAA